MSAVGGGFSFPRIREAPTVPLRKEQNVCTEEWRSTVGKRAGRKNPRIGGFRMN
jgi:hypothetical protein